MSTNRGEQRRSKRIPTKMNLEVSSLFKQDNVKVNNINAPIEVIDISKFTYNDYVALGKRMSEGIWKKADQAVQVARQYGIEPLW